VEQEFIQKLIDGNETAFKQLVDSYKDMVVTTCFGFVNNYADADDVTQEVFIEVFRSVANFNKEAKLSTWIYRIAVNKSLDFLRKSKRKKRWADLFRIDSPSDDSLDNWFVYPSAPDLELEQKERMQILAHAIGKLPKNQQIAFTLNKYDDLSYKEIADIMETSLSSIESLLHRAKNNLKKQLKVYYENNL
jgi:RNA polymerase sigma-70 factor (ECF subfamily)